MQEVLYKNYALNSSVKKTRCKVKHDGYETAQQYRVYLHLFIYAQKYSEKIYNLVSY